MVTLATTRCPQCGDAWLIFPNGHSKPRCLRCDLDHGETLTLSPAEAQVKGVNVALAMHRHTDELRRSWLRRNMAFVGAMVRAAIADWGCRLERWAREGARG